MSITWKTRINNRRIAFLDLRDPLGRRFIRSLRTSDPIEAQQRYHELAAVLLAGKSRPDRSTIDALRDRVMPYIAAFRSSASRRS